MPEVRGMASVKADTDSVEPYRPGSESSPGRDGGSVPGPSNKLAGETLSLKRTPMSRAAHKGDKVTRRME